MVKEAMGKTLTDSKDNERGKIRSLHRDLEPTWTGRPHGKKKTVHPTRDGL